MDAAKVREAACACGGLKVKLQGDPMKVSSCCCQQCQRRTGSFYGVTAFFEEGQIVRREGAESVFRRIGESGEPLDFRFCPGCGSTVWWTAGARPGRVMLAAGAFADPDFPAPERLIWTEHRHPSVLTADGVAEYPRSPG